MKSGRKQALTLENLARLKLKNGALVDEFEEDNKSVVKVAKCFKLPLEKEQSLAHRAVASFLARLAKLAAA